MANPWLIAAGWMSIAAALLHVACILGGPGWYRFFGAGEPIARAAERGSWGPPLITMGIATILGIWAVFAFAGAEMLPRLPLMRTALVAISAVALARGLVIVHPSLLGRPDLSPTFMIWSSLIVLAMGLLFAIGTWRAWSYLSAKGIAA
ncbi:MAG TPA: hypothetical protein VNI79_01270 [Sphingomicrobium sp.]|nr:hypothetical protein [Sphingomicrobium sp.]